MDYQDIPLEDRVRLLRDVSINIINSNRSEYKYVTKINVHKTLFDLKKKIKEEYDPETKIEVEDITFLCKGNILIDNMRTIQNICLEYLTSGSILDLHMLLRTDISDDAFRPFDVTNFPQFGKNSSNFGLSSRLKELSKEISNLVPTGSTSPLSNPLPKANTLPKNPNLRKAVLKFEEAHLHLMKTLELNYQLNLLTERFIPHKIPTPTDIHQQKRNINISVQYGHDGNVTHTTTTSETQTGQRVRENRRVVVNLQQPDINAQQQNPQPANRNANANENNNNAGEPRERRRLIVQRLYDNVLRFFNISLILRIGMFLYIFYGTEVSFDDYDFLKTLAFAFGYYLYEVGMLGRLLGAEMSFTALLNNISQHRHARIQRVTEEELQNQPRQQRLYTDSVIFIKSLFLSLIPTWQVREEVVEVDPVPVVIPNPIQNNNPDPMAAPNAN